MTWNGLSIARVTAKMTSEGAEAVQNVFHVRNSGANASNGAALTAIGEWLENVYTNIVSVLSEHVTFQSYNVLLYATDTALGDYAWPTLTVGGATGDQLPASAACLSLYRTFQSGRIGRTYWGPFSETSQDGGIWTAGTVTACQNAAVAVATSFAASNGITMLGLTYSTTYFTELPAANVATSANVRSQRRRNRLIGI